TGAPPNSPSAGTGAAPDVPLRARLRPRAGRRAAAPRPALPLQAAGALRPVREHVHVRPLLRRVAAHRPVAPLRRPAAERVGLDRRVRPLDRVLHRVAVLPHAEGSPAAEARRASAGPDDGDPARSPLI